MYTHFLYMSIFSSQIARILWNIGQVHFIKPGHLTMWLANHNMISQPENEGGTWEPIHQGFDIIYIGGTASTSLSFILLSFTILLTFSASFLPSFYTLTVCLSLPQPLFLAASFLLFFLSCLSSTPCVPPSVPSLSLWHSILKQARSLPVLICHPPSLLSSLMSPFSQSPSQFFIVSLASFQWINQELPDGQLQKKSMYQGDNLLEILLLCCSQRW